MNDKTLSKNNKTGYTGVCFEANAKKYRAYIYVNGDQRRLGYFSNIEDAVKARKDAEDFYRGYKARFDLRDYYPLPRYVLSRVRKLFPNTDLDFAICTSGLIHAALQYDASCDFSNYYYKMILGFLDEEGIVKMNEDEKTKFKEAKLDFFFVRDEEDKLMLLKWLNGYSIRRIAKEHCFSNSSVKRKIDQTKKKALKKEK